MGNFIRGVLVAAGAYLIIRSAVADGILDADEAKQAAAKKAAEAEVAPPAAANDSAQ